MLHDIGKVRTPLDVLNKPGALTPEERTIIRRHPLDGASILRASPDMPRLAAIVAFEHHLRIDGTGYPAASSGRRSTSARTVRHRRRVRRDALDEGVSVRHARRPDHGHHGQQQRAAIRPAPGPPVHPPDGSLSAATLVRLTDGSAGIVVDAGGAPAPVVKVILGSDGARLDVPLVTCLDQGGGPESGHRALAIDAPLDPAQFDLDPADYL